MLPCYVLLDLDQNSGISRSTIHFIGGTHEQFHHFNPQP